MIGDFVSADYGWLWLHDGLLSAHVELKLGKNCEGYFTNDEVLDQMTSAMDIVEFLFPDDQHVFIFDNATTHAKRADGALSARYMPKGTSKPGKNWMISINKHDSDGKLVYGSDGKLVKEKICMGDATLPDGRPQQLYFPANHPTHPGLFKGMAVILEERGFTNAKQLCAECGKNFHCEKGADGEWREYCCHQVLFNQPDFVSVPSLLETHCKARGFKVLFLLKFHPELNCIEQCWRFAKQVYCECPPSSSIEDLEANTRMALAAVPIESIRKYVFNLQQEGHIVLIPLHKFA
jgi:hypothetical protein